MKKNLLLLFLSVTGIMQAQVVNIPDANFKNYLLSQNNVDANEDGEIQVEEALNVQYLDVFESTSNTFSSLEGIQAFANLTTMEMSLSTLTAIDLSGLQHLENLHIMGLNVSNLNLEGLENLQGMYLEFMPLESLDVSNLTSLQSLDLSGFMDLTSLTVGENPNLRNVYLYTPKLHQIDLSECPNIEHLNIWLDSDDQDSFVNLKNGNPGYMQTSQVSDINNSSVSTYKFYVCIDEGEENNFAQSENTVLSTYCTFSPGGNYNVITGSLLFDDEGDGCDSNDTVISNIKLNINDGSEAGSTISTTGLYEFFTQSGTFTVTPDFDNDLFTITPPFAEINFTEVDSLVTTQNFCLTPNGSHPDLEIVIVPYGARPGFDAVYKIVYRNKGNQMLSGSVVFTYQEDELDLVVANPSENMASPGTLTWNFTGLAPFQQREIYVILNVNGPMETPAVNIDDQLAFTAMVNPESGDETPQDNTFTLQDIVMGSFDPNDITCLEGSSVHPDKIGEYLHYNINFENTGTAPATFIVVKDVIDTTRFDMASLELLNASHPVQVKIAGNKAEFRFDNINLGPQEKGNLTFKIKTLNTLHANDNVTQKADIFFDYNWPIGTNEATTVFEVLSRNGFEQDGSVKIYPNPSNGVVNISAASEIKSTELYDIQGRLLQAGKDNALDISGRASGTYFLKIRTESGVKVEKLIKE